MPEIPKATPALIFQKFGNADEELRFENIPMDAWTEDSIHLKMLAAPINPSDILAIAGIYPTPLPQVGQNGARVPGFEGVARVEVVGANVKDLKVGDYVLPAAQVGTWRKELICNYKKVIKVPNSLPVKALATLLVNPTTALRMLEDYVKLKPSDVIAQNAGNSTVGQAVIQMAKSRGIKTINIIRDRKNFNEEKAFLQDLGATIVLKEGELLPYLKENPVKIQLAFNAVGGKSGTDLASGLSEKGILVNYGRLSEEPMTVPVADFIFKDIELRGFWLSTWINTHSEEEFGKMFQDLFKMLESGILKVPSMDEIPFSDLGKDANMIKKVFGSGGKKKILMFT
ncbi:hypothetical protein HMI54_014280 [Coelomomyces lativittatus]|nr:hypothetical protein HMI56_004032 [Coelomomyces lativittatus]KAJ1511319.1 hypothetical protein HMI55_006640 [Coelomomyces lativittatus]KAJ1514312.1 hypothetical protein HMI54_014280 [Coelomomyces lativittatus]